MTVEGITATAALIAAVGAVGSAIAAIIGAVNAARGKKAANETKELLKQIIAVQQTNTQQQNLNFYGPTTVGSLTAPPARELTFLPEAVPAASAILPAHEDPLPEPPSESGQRGQE
jgi:hypothetical protein